MSKVSLNYQENFSIGNADVSIMLIPEDIMGKCHEKAKEFCKEIEAIILSSKEAQSLKL